MVVTSDVKHWYIVLAMNRWMYQLVSLYGDLTRLSIMASSFYAIKSSGCLAIVMTNHILMLC